ncbi:hypothetical protein KIPB_006512 [Kipferlia bialata]|uniref:Uncharacterized protein n=1 Tax=Kipferlia bialata TaxID=797122 RepID=A0A9K3GJ59_9EUKA|nr:hypothetical protein KIPB_006512 [Kipferlia bialata]|eukprot:g6512.t1
MANALVLSNRFRGRGPVTLTPAEVVGLQQWLGEYGTVRESIDTVWHSLKAIRKSEKALAPHKHHSLSHNVSHALWKHKPKTDTWLLNSEIHDIMSHLAGPSPPMVFMRYSKYPIRHQAPQRERERIEAEESRFGGRVVNGSAVYKVGESEFIVDEIQPETALRLPLEHIEHRPSELRESSVCIVDCNGHFVAALACHITPDTPVVQDTEFEVVSEHGMPQPEGVPALLLFNSLPGPVKGSACIATYDMCHGY